MGLSIQVGLLADLLENDAEGAEWLREGLAEVNRLLVAKGLPPHHEPEALAPLSSRSPTDGFPYSCLHYLRRAYAHCVADPKRPATPLPDSERASHDPVVEALSNQMTSHLLCHSDAEGFYVPVDFRPVLWDDAVPGAMLGSSQRLFEELVFVAPALGIRLYNGVLVDAEADQITQAIDAEDGLHVEKMVWLCLYESARLSIEHKTAICFG